MVQCPLNKTILLCKDRFKILKPSAPYHTTSKMGYFFILSLFYFLTCRTFASSFGLRWLQSENSENDNYSKVIKFSILLKPASNITADDFFYSDYNSFMESKTYKVYKSVIDVTTKLLCQKTKFQMIVDEKDSCSTTKTDTSTSLDVTQFLADLNRLDVMVRDVNYTWVESQGDDSDDDDDDKQQQSNTIQWVEFFIHYPILQTGSDVNYSKAVAFDTARAKIENAINDNTFTKKLVLKSDLIIAVANVGDENTVFSPWAQLWESLASTSNSSSDEIIPPLTQTAHEQQALSLQSFFYPIRIAGLILLGITIFVVTFMICLAEKRKKSRELEEQDILPLAQRNLTSLHTTEGLNAILDGGRQVALQKQMNMFT